MADLAVLRTAKVAMDEGLLTQDDFDQIKLAFLKAQQIKAGLDAGFIREEDFLQARDSFLHSLDFRVNLQSSKSGSLPSPVASPTGKAPVPPSPRGTTTTTTTRGLASQNSGGTTAAVTRSTTMPTSQTRSTGGAVPARPTTTTTSRPASGAAPAASAIARQGSSGGSAAVAAAAAQAAAPALAAEASGGSLMPGTVAVPTDLPRIGRAGVADGKTSMSGIRVADSCINLYNHIKTKSTYKWVSYRIDDAGCEVIVDQLGSRQSTYGQFLDIMPQSECRFAVYDYGYSNADTQQTVQKLVFVHWAPECSPIKMKMMYASTKEFLKGFLEGIGAELQADSLSELDEQEMITRIHNNITRK